MKLPKLYAESSAFTSDILAFTETWLKPEISDSEVLSNNCKAYRTDRSSRRGGGGLIAVTTSLTSERIHLISLSKLNLLV